MKISKFHYNEINMKIRKILKENEWDFAHVIDFVQKGRGIVTNPPKCAIWTLYEHAKCWEYLDLSYLRKNHINTALMRIAKTLQEEETK